MILMQRNGVKCHANSALDHISICTWALKSIGGPSHSPSPRPVGLHNLCNTSSSTPPDVSALLVVEVISEMVMQQEESMNRFVRKGSRK